MPVEFTSVLSADGAPAKKKGAQTSFDAMAEAEQALKEWQIAQEKKKNPSGNITLPTWSTLKEARQQAAEKKKVTYQKLNSAKKLADVREQQWEKLNAIYERDKKSLEEIEPVRKELEKFKYLANDYQEKISRMEAFRTQHQLNPTYENSENFYAAMEEVTRWENDHKRDLEKYNRLYQEYDTVVKEYNRAAESLNRYGPAAQDAVKTYANLFDSYDWANQDGLSDAVKQDYAKLEKSREEAEKQALAEYKDQLLAQKNDLENQLRGSARSLLQGGDFFQNLKTQRDVQGEIDTVRGELQILEERESAEKAEQEARSDPQFKNNAKKGARIVDEYLKIIMNSGNLDSYEEYNAMTDEQKEIYSYYMYSDPEKANAYKQGISKEINQTLAAKRQNLMEQSIEENPTLAGLSTLITRPFTTGRITAEALASLGQDGSRIADPNTRGQAQLRAEESARQASLKQMDNPVLQTLGQAGYAIADMAPSILANMYLPGAGTAYMGLMEGSGLYADAASRGLTNRQALTFGATGAVVSTALEKIGLDKIGAAFAGGKKPATQLLRQIAGSFLAEGSEEAAENVAQTIYDEVISGTKSARNQAIQQYMSQGMSREEAEKRAWMDMGKDTLNAFIVGGLAGGAMSGAGGVANNLLPSTSQQLQDMGLTRAEAENLVNSQRPEREYSIKLGGYNPEVSVSTEGIQEQYGISNLNNKGEVINKISAALENSYLSTDTQSKPITNIDTGMQIEIRKSGINETFGNDKYYSSRSGEYKKAKIAIMPELAKLIKYGEVRAPEAGNYHNPNSKVRYAYLTAPATVDGVDYQVTMDIRRSPNGENRFYIHDLQIEEADGGSRAPITNGKGQLKGSTPSAVGTNITSGSENVNTEIKQVPNSMTEDGARVAPSTPASVGDFYTPSVASDPQNVNAESRAAIEKLSSDMGITTVFDDTLPQSVNGYYDTQTGEIHINPNADVNTVFSHELAHSLENTSAYQKLKSLVLNELGDEAETLRQQKTELYNRLGKELDVDSELVADYISQNLFTDADSIRRVAEADRGLATRIKNWITRMIAKVTGKSEKAFLAWAEELYSQALQEASQGREAVSLNSTQQAEVNAQGEAAEAGSEAKNYSVSADQQVDRLRRENQELRRQMTRTTENMVNPSRLKSTVRQLLRGYSSQYPSSSLESDLNDLYTLMGNEEVQRNGETVARSYEAVKSEAMDIAKKILDGSEVLNGSQEYQDIVGLLKSNSLYIPENIRRDIDGGYAGFQRAHRSEINFQQDGQPIEELWQTLESEYPGLFTEEYINPGDMVNRLGEVLTRLKPSKTNPFTAGQADFATEQEFLANDIMERFYSIPQRAPTFADKQAAKLVREKIRSRKQLDAEKNRGQARVQKVREENRAKRIELKKASSEKVKQARADERDKGQKRLKELKVRHKELDDAARDRRYRADTRQKIQRHVADLSHKLLHPSDKSHIPDELTQPVANLLDAVNLESTFSTMLGQDGKLHRAAPDEGAPTKRTQAFRELREAYVKIANNPRYKNEMVIDPDLQANIDAVIAMKDIRLQDMTQEQLNTVWATVAAVEHSISTANQLFAEGRYKTLEAQAKAVYDGLQMQKTKVERRGPVGAVDRLLNIENVTPFDYFHEWGEGGDALFAAARAAQDTQIRDYVDVQNFLADVVTGKEIKKWRETRSETFRVNGKSINLTIPQKMALYLLDQREQGREHIYGGGIEQGAVTVKGNKVEKSTEPVRVTPEDVKRITSTLTDRQKEVADSLGKYMSTYLAERGNLVSMQLYGYQKFTESNYFPINVDPNYTARQLGETQVQGRIEGKGFTKALEQNAGNPLVLYDIFSTFAKHAAEMTSYHAWLPFLKDAERVYNFRMGDGFSGSISEQISRVLGSGGAKYFENFIADLNGQANLRNDFDASALLSNYKRAAVGANLRVIIQQPTAYFRALAVLDSQDLAKGVFTPKKWELVKRWAPIAQWKDWGYFEVNTGRQLEDVILDTDSRFEKFQQGLMAAAGKADEVTWTRLWGACESYVKRKFKEISVGSDQYYMKVAEKFNEVVDRTQVVDSVLHRTQIMRSPSTLNKMASAFMGEPSKTYNLLRTALRDVKAARPGAKGKAAKMFYHASLGFLISGTVNAAAASVIDALRDDDEDETYLEKWWQAFSGLQGDEEDWTEVLQNLLSGNVADNLNILNMIPYVKAVSYTHLTLPTN